ncbi:hypothetical protein TH53_22575 [Pedobacter lusitanus]|uniref:GLPGLI family protein n=2 Tax=Pedobacter lusitanus TaxID=1503925 RepID=A0A0D0GCN7_9SPHI|nr:hypothetical protein TH53_22575 [Pedobacter lusitanus]
MVFSVQVYAQNGKSGIIKFESTFDPAALTAANGIKLSNEAAARMPGSSITSFELLFNPDKGIYRQVAEPNKNKHTHYSGSGFFGAGPSRHYYYNFENHHLLQAFVLNDTLFLVEDKLGILPVPGDSVNHPAPVIEYTKSDEIKQILGFNCHQVTASIKLKHKIQGVEKEITDQFILWYTNEPGFDFSPNPVLWTEGVVLAIEGKGTRTEAKSMHYQDVNPKELDLPANRIIINQEQLRSKIDLRRKQANLSRIGSWN